MDERPTGEPALPDDELSVLALGAEPHDPFTVDAEPFGLDAAPGGTLLPAWYMPPPQRSAADRTPGRLVAVGAVVVSLVLLNGVGLCVTYGIPEIAW